MFHLTFFVNIGAYKRFYYLDKTCLQFFFCFKFHLNFGYNYGYSKMVFPSRIRELYTCVIVTLMWLRGVSLAWFSRLVASRSGGN